MQKKIINVAMLAVALAATTIASQAHATFFGAPRALKSQVAKLSFRTPSLAPMAYSLFCVRHPEECRAPRMVFRPRPVEMTVNRWFDLVAVNHDVNGAIAPKADTVGELEIWRVSPSAGNCHDYAVTKRHELLQRGWPAHALILSEVVTAWGEHHLVLVVRAKGGDLVLDNLHANVRPMAAARYRWVRAQSPKNPNFWAAVKVTTTFKTAMLDRPAAPRLD